MIFLGFGFKRQSHPSKQSIGSTKASPKLSKWGGKIYDVRSDRRGSQQQKYFRTARLLDRQL
jgi:hypothetical protein